MTDVGVIGAGYSGLTLALRLRQLGVSTTLYAEATPDELRAGRLPNTVGRFPHTRARERALGVDHRSSPEEDHDRLALRLGPPVDAGYVGRFVAPARATDFRVLLPGLVEDVAARGGRVEVLRSPDEADVERLAERHAVLVVANGRRSMGALFPVDPTRSPHARPPRVVFAGLFDGLAPPEDRAVSINVAPGVGEVVQMAIRTPHGMGTSILVNAIPGGPLAQVATGDPDAPGFARRLRALLAEHAPAVAARATPGLALTGPRDHLQGAITPAVRRAWRVLLSGRLVLAVGDAWITNDPITGQGANLGSHSAWEAADRIAGRLATGGPFDGPFGERLEAAMWTYAEPVTRFTNAFLEPPPPHVMALTAAAVADPAVADRYVALFDDPPAMWRTVSSPEATAAFVAAARAGVGAPA